MAKIYSLKRYKLEKDIKDTEKQIVHFLENAPFFDNYGITLLKERLDQLKKELIEFEEKEYFYEQKRY